MLCPMRFIHSADLHIDSPLRGLDHYPGAPVERLRGATRQAFAALIDLALREHVDFVLLAGDIYDGDWLDFRTGLFFREQLLRLQRAGIRTFIVHGNHDAASQITRRLPRVEGVHTFSEHTPETVILKELGVAIHGRSFPNRAVTEDLVPTYPAAIPGLFNIGMLHTSLNGREGHDNYAPTTIDMLCSRGYDYFALGHVHAREVVREAHPRIVYPGNLQGRHARETGPKGCELVTVEGGRIVASEFVPLDVVRWHVLTFDATGIADIDELAHRFLMQARPLTARQPEILHAIRVHLHGESDLYRTESRQPGTLAASLQSASQEADGFEIWIEQVHVQLRAPLARVELLQRMDAAGEVARVANELSTDPEELRKWFAEKAGTLRLPPALQHLAQLPDDELQTLLAEAEATVLAHLLQMGGDPSR